MGVSGIFVGILLYLDFYMGSHNLPEAGNQFVLSDTIKEVIQQNGQWKASFPFCWND